MWCGVVGERRSSISSPLAELELDLPQKGRIERAKIGYRLPNQPSVTWGFPSDEDPKALGILEKDIQTISFSHYYPGNPYEELPVARLVHPAMGSFTAHITMKDGRKATVSDIYYQDMLGHRSMPYPHWNHQTRLQWIGAQYALVNEPLKHHALPKMDWIELIREGRTGCKVDRLKWRKQDEVLRE